MIILLGVSGAGKTLQGDLLAEREGWISLSMGQLLRDHADAKTQDLMRQGIWLDQQTTGKILLEALQQYDLSRVVLDGYPRTKDQAEWAVDHFKQNKFPIEKILLLEADVDTVVERMKARKRVDDTEDAIRLRLENYFREIDSVLECIKSAQIPFATIDARRDIEAVYKDIVEQIHTL